MRDPASWTTLDSDRLGVSSIRAPQLCNDMDAQPNFSSSRTKTVLLASITSGCGIHLRCIRIIEVATHGLLLKSRSCTSSSSNRKLAGMLAKRPYTILSAGVTRLYA